MEDNEYLDTQINTLKDPIGSTITQRAAIIQSIAIELRNDGDVRAIEPLIEVLTNLKPNAKNRYAREEIVKALGEFEDERAVEILIISLEDKNEHIRSNVAQALGRIGAAQSVVPLIRTLNDKYWFARCRAAEALGKIKDKQATDSLIDLLKDDHVRKDAAWALGEIGDTKAVKPLIDALGEENEHIRGLQARLPGPGDNLDNWSNLDRPVALALIKLGIF